MSSCIDCTKILLGIIPKKISLLVSWGVISTKRILPTFALVFVLILALVSGSADATNRLHITTRLNESSVFVMAATYYTPHEPIVIASDDDFSVQGWPGSGIETDPYMIEELSIISTEVCISVSDITVYFEIRNCFLSSPVQASYDGIYIDNVTHCSISDCFIESHRRGICLLNSDNCSFSNNTAVGNTQGFCLYSSDACTLTNNTASNNSQDGFYLNHSSNCTLANNTMWGTGLFIEGYTRSDWVHTISNNTVNGKPLGYIVSVTATAVDSAQYGQMIIANCSSVSISNGVFHDTSVGLQMAFCTDCQLTNNTATGGSYGFHLFLSGNCMLRNNTATSNTCNFYLEGSDSCMLVGNNIATGGFYGFNLYWSSSCTIINNTASSNARGFYLYHSDNGILINDMATNNSFNFYLQSSDGCMVINNTAIDGSYGFALSYIEGCVLTNNTAVNNIETNFHLALSNTCTLTNNTATSDSCNFRLYRSDSFVLANNTMWGTGLVIEGEIQSNWIHTILNDTVNEKPLGYFFNETGTAVDGAQYGQVIMVNCSSVNVSNGTFLDGSVGLQIAYCSDCTFTNNTITNSMSTGFYLYHSDNCMLTNNTVNKLDDGFLLNHSDNCTLTNNTVINNVYNGINLSSSDNCMLFNNTVNNNVHDGFNLYSSRNCTLTNNTVIGNYYGIILDQYSSGNRLFLNRIGPNSHDNAADYGSDNTWDDNLSLGNYWSDYDGIGVYEIPGDARSVDRYPLWSENFLIIDSPSDVLYEEGNTGHSITWTPLSSHPNRYELFRNGSLIDSGAWDGSEITVIVDGLGVGVYNYTLVVYNDYGDSESNSVFVTVIGPEFSSSGPLLILLVSAGVALFAVTIVIYFRKR